MKNIALSLSLVFLFGLFFPSAKAYSNHNNYVLDVNLQSKFSLNDNLINRLATSKTFEHYFYSLFTIGSITVSNMSMKTEKNLKESLEKLEIIKNKENATISDFTGLADFKIDKESIRILNDYAEKFKIEFSELLLMSSEQKEDILNKAIIKGDLVNKARTVFADMESCKKDAVREYVYCMNHNSWVRYALATCVIVGFMAILLTALVLTASTAGSGAAVVATFLGGFMSVITVACTSAFLISFNGQLELNCKTGQVADLTACHLLYD